MLKIKDNVDLKEIGCDISEDEFDQIWAYDELLFDKDTRRILENQFFSDVVDVRLENLYDLIQAGLVEKIEEE